MDCPNCGGTMVSLGNGKLKCRFCGNRMDDPNYKAPAAPAAAPAPAPVAAAPANGEKLLSPFPGLIKNLLVDNGATVKKDQPILVLEAMKMDNDITAPCDGVVSFNVVKGANVETDAVLAVIG